MIPASHLLTFALLSFALIIVPGPNVLFVISRSLMLGRAAGVGTALGGQLGVYVQVTAVAFGVGAIVERSVAVFTVIKLAGAAYLVYLGVQALRNRQALSAALEGSTERKTIRRIVRDGFIVGASNPKAIIRPVMSRRRCCCSVPSSWRSPSCATAAGRWPRAPRGVGWPARRAGSSWSAAPAAWS